MGSWNGIKDFKENVLQAAIPCLIFWLIIFDIAEKITVLLSVAKNGSWFHHPAVADPYFKDGSNKSSSFVWISKCLLQNRCVHCCYLNLTKPPYVHTPFADMH